jgi:hypothetical protein
VRKPLGKQRRWGDDIKMGPVIKICNTQKSPNYNDKRAQESYPRNYATRHEDISRV